MDGVPGALGVLNPSAPLLLLPTPCAYVARIRLERSPSCAGTDQKGSRHGLGRPLVHVGARNPSIVACKSQPTAVPDAVDYGLEELWSVSTVVLHAVGNATVVTWLAMTHEVL